MPPSAADAGLVAEPVGAEPVGAAGPGCEACSHPRTLHDPIALRYCAATTSGTLTRRCVCSASAAH